MGDKDDDHLTGVEPGSDSGEVVADDWEDSDPGGVQGTEVRASVIPDSPAGMDTPLLKWEPSDYLFGGSGAAKLASSAVAPLVAAARGYDTVSVDDVDEKLPAFGLGTPRSVKAKTLRKCAATGDTLTIPLFNIGIVAKAAVDLAGGVSSGPPRPQTFQFRPSVPVTAAKSKKPAKYLFVPEAAIPLDVHPATPVGWLQSPMAVMVVEGTIKADSALTALLRSCGVSDEELVGVRDGTDAAGCLRGLMEGVAAESRVLIVSIAGVQNWRHNPEWTYVPMRGRDVLVAFDGDVAENHDVWRQAKLMFDFVSSAKGEPFLVDLSNVTIEDSVGRAEKAGIDDYLARVGRWGSLANLVTDQLPVEPLLIEPGDVRMNEDDAVCEIFVAGSDGSGGFWTVEAPASARVSRIVEVRGVSPREEQTGEVDRVDRSDGRSVDETRPDPDEVRVEVEVRWNDREHGMSRSVVSGPVEMLITTPEGWAKAGVDTPVELCQFGDWPFRTTSGQNWLKATKEHRAGETESTVIWNRMGWVPTTESPRFIVGGQVIGPDGFEQTDLARPGVGEREVSQSSGLGVLIPSSTEEGVQAVRDVLDLYETVWSDPRVAGVVLSAALRPLVMKPKQAPLLFTGAHRSGKSWTAAAIMAFWQSEPGTWRSSHLPGSADSTFASLETVLAKTPIWVIDDLAPSADPNKARDDETKISRLVRAVANRSTRSRMTRDMTARAGNPPQAQVIFTAENALSVSSAMDRVVHVQFGAGAISSNDAKQALDLMSDELGTQAKVTGLLLKWLAGLIAKPSPAGRGHSWVEVREMFEFLYEENREVAPHFMKVQPGKADRHIEMAADLGLGLSVLASFCQEELGDKELADRVFKLQRDAFALISEHHLAQQRLTPGRVIIDVLRECLASGSAHLSGVSTDGLPVSGDNAVFINRALGWEIVGDSPAKPKGVAIGYVVERDGNRYVLLLAQAAFRQAQKTNPQMIPHGSKAATAWGALKDEGLGLISGPWNYRKRGGRIAPYVAVKIHGTVGDYVPMRLDSLLGVDEDQEPPPK